MNKLHTIKTHVCDLCVVGGGLAGLSAALAAARHGIRVILIQDRPMLGGNSSSEIRMWVRGAGEDLRESGIISELDLANIYRNPHMNAHMWDMVLYDAARKERNLTLLLNCSVCDAEAREGHIFSVTGWQLTTYTVHTVRATFFADCSGDSILAPLVGAKYTVGREGKDEYGEEMAVSAADGKHMGMSCLLQARETDHPVAFIPPSWAEKVTEEQLVGKAHDCVNTRANFWWIETGGDTEDGIADTEVCRDRLLALVMGVWDHIKNTPGHGAENWELEWVGFLPGKRESRRYVGDYVLCARDLVAGRQFADAVAYGGWTMDNHDPAGYDAEGYSSVHTPVHRPYLIPYRTLYSANVDNLFFAGRNISATHMAISSTRVMATCALLGQAVGTAAAVAVHKGLSPRGVCEHAIEQLQRLLLDDGVWLPDRLRTLHPVMNGAVWSYGGEVFEDGMERQLNGKGHYAVLREPLSLTLAAPILEEGYCLRLALDPDYSRSTINPTGVYNPYSQKSHRRLDFQPLAMPSNLLKDMCICMEDSTGRKHKTHLRDNHLPLLVLSVPVGTVKVTLTATAWRGEPRIFSFDVIKT